MEKQQRFAISLQTAEQSKSLVQFSATISQNCRKFTQQFLKGLKVTQFMQKPSQIYVRMLHKYFKYKKTKTASPICAKVLLHNQFAFKCFECQNEDNSIICIECFNKSKHEGHRYQKIAVYGGCCDCGDDEKWKAEGSCTDHNSKNIAVDIDPALTEQFIHEMKYIIYLVFVLSFNSILTTQHKLHQAALLEGLINFLMQYNKQSMISNEMTFLFFKSKFDDFPKLHYSQKSYSIKVSVFNVLMKFDKQKQYSRKLIDLFIMMFTRQEFKKYLTIQYTKVFNQRSEIILSQMANITCQVFTSHKIIDELLNEGKLMPIKVQNNSIRNKKFDNITDIYARFYIDITYLTSLYNKIGEKYTQFYLQKGNIVDLTGYETLAREDPADSIPYYGIQHILFYNRIPVLMKHITNKQDITLKAIKDVIEQLKLKSSEETLNLYISRERTLLVLLFIYSKGQVQKLATVESLEFLGLQYETIYKTLQAVLNVIRFYSVIISNRQTVQRFYTLFSFCFYKKPHILVSIDFLLLKFCLLALENYQKPNFSSKIDESNLKYQHFTTFELNEMPVDNLLTLPFKLMNKALDQIRDDEEGAYDRKKALGYAVDYLGLLQEMTLTNYSQLQLKFIYLEQNQQQFINFYGVLLKSITSIKYEHLKQMSKAFFGDEELILTKFVKQYCEIDGNKKIKLKLAKQQLFQAVNLRYYKSLKCHESMVESVAQNQKRFELKKIPQLSKQSQQTKNQLTRIIFNSTMIESIIESTNKYLQAVQKFPIITKDIAPFIDYYIELLKLRHVIDNPQINSLCQKIKNRLKQFPQELISQIKKNFEKTLQLETMQENKQEVSKKTEQQKKKQNEVKLKKLQKFKSKQTKAINSLGDQLEQNTNRNDQQISQCLYCKLSNENEPLSIMCFKQKSSLLQKNLFKIDRAVDMITSCNHHVHLTCHKTANGNRQYTYCTFCKTSSNFLVTQPSKTQKNIENPPKKKKLFMSQQLQLQEQIDQEYQQNDNIEGIKKYSLQFFEDQLDNQEQVNKLKQMLTEEENQIETIAQSIFYGVFIDFDFFYKSLANVCSLLIRSLAKNSAKIKIQNLLNSLQSETDVNYMKQNEIQNWQAYRFTILLVGSMIGVQRDNSEIRKYQMALPKQLIQSILMILSAVKSQHCMKSLQKVKMTPYCAIQIRNLPDSLDQLAKEMGSCPCCSRITNQIALCLLCEFKSCVGCEDTNLTAHAAQKHGQASIFIRIDEGWVYYITRAKNRVFASIYVNQLDQFFTLFKNNQAERKDFKLDKNAFNKIRTDLIRHRVQQQIRYEQLKTSKVSNLNP